jgi:hypothetical protein
MMPDIAALEEVDDILRDVRGMIGNSFQMMRHQNQLQQLHEIVGVLLGLNDQNAFDLMP